MFAWAESLTNNFRTFALQNHGDFIWSVFGKCCICSFDSSREEPKSLAVWQSVVAFRNCPALFQTYWDECYRYLHNRSSPLLRINWDRIPQWVEKFTFVYWMSKMFSARRELRVDIKKHLLLLSCSRVQAANGFVDVKYWQFQFSFVDKINS